MKISLLHLLWTGRHTCSSGPNHLPKARPAPGQFHKRPARRHGGWREIPCGQCTSITRLTRVKANNGGIADAAASFPAQYSSGPGCGAEDPICCSIDLPIERNNIQGNCVFWRQAFVATRRWCDETAPCRHNSALTSLVLLHASDTIYNFIPMSTSTSAPYRETHN